MVESDDEDERLRSAKPPASRWITLLRRSASAACVQEDDEESLASGTSSKRKRTAYQNAFPVSGVRCVGCALANRIAPVESFVNANIGRQSERALWRFSEYVWRTQVCEPARREGVDVPSWGWRDIASHFKLHTTLPTIGRTSMVQTLSAMRFQIEGSLVRNDDGVRSLDKSNAELALKVRSCLQSPLTTVHLLVHFLTHADSCRRVARAPAAAGRAHCACRWARSRRRPRIC